MYEHEELMYFVSTKTKKDKKTIVYIEMRNAQMDVVAGMW